MRKCTKCCNSKSLNEFAIDKNSKDGLNYWCKICIKEYYQKNKTKHLVRTKKYQEENKEHLQKFQKEWYQDNKQSHKKIMRGWRKTNPNYFKEYYQNNKQERYNYKKERYKNDIHYRLLKTLRDRIYKAVKKGYKSGKSIDLLGCSIELYEIYLKSKFKGPMNIDNYGKVWEIDHIIPCSSFDLTDPEQQKKCFHYTNTQPLLITENRQKSNKI